MKRRGAALAATALGMIAAAAAAQSPHRSVVVVSDPHDPRAARQQAILARDAGAMRERDVVVLAITPQAARRDRPDLGVTSHTTFEILLVGKDGGVKLRRDQPVAASEIAALIDTMPMRRNEMSRRP